MNRQNYYDFYGIKNKLCEVREIEDSVIEEKSDASQAILQAIYALDPITKLPTGDIMCYLSSNTPPEVKQYIMNNLMSDVSSQKLPSLPVGLDEETAFAIERKFVNGSYESLDSYRERINAFMHHQVEVRNMAIENARASKASQPSKE